MSPAGTVAVPVCCEQLAEVIDRDDTVVTYLPAERAFVATQGFAQSRAFSRCPWCGARLPDALTEQWRDLVTGSRGDPDSPELLDGPLQSSSWWDADTSVPTRRVAWPPGLGETERLSEPMRNEVERLGLQLSVAPGSLPDQCRVRRHQDLHFELCEERAQRVVVFRGEDADEIELECRMVLGETRVLRVTWTRADGGVFLPTGRAALQPISSVSRAPDGE